MDMDMDYDQTRIKKKDKGSNTVCLSFLLKIQYLVPNLVYDDAPPDPLGRNVRQIAYTLYPDVSLIGSSPVYSISDDGSTGKLKFCLGLDIYLPDNVTMVNWR